MVALKEQLVILFLDFGLRNRFWHQLRERFCGMAVSDEVVKLFFKVGKYLFDFQVDVCFEFVIFAIVVFKPEFDEVAVDDEIILILIIVGFLLLLHKPEDLTDLIDSKFFHLLFVNMLDPVGSMFFISYLFILIFSLLI